VSRSVATSQSSNSARSTAPGPPKLQRAAIQLSVAAREAMETSSSRFRPSAKPSMATRLPMNCASAWARLEASIGDRPVTAGMPDGRGAALGRRDIERPPEASSRAF
jgi:hypothetical protein